MEEKDYVRIKGVAMKNREKEKIFLEKLEALTKKTGIAVACCGCCGSPYLLKVDINDPKAGYGYGDSDLQ